MRINIFKNRPVFRKGFLLPDVMIAVFVVAGALVAILSVMAPTIKAEFFKRDQMIATGLAQEGIEIMRNARDNNWKKSSDNVSQPVNAFDSNSLFPSSGTYCPDYLTTDFTTLTCNMNTSDSYLQQNTTTGLYGRGGSGKFKRTVSVSGSGDTRLITSTVQWGTGTSKHEVVLTDTLTDWGNKQ